MSAGLLAEACSGFVGEAFVNRRAILTARVATSDSRPGVRCTVTSLLFGEDDSRIEIATGAEATLLVGMATPANAPAPVKARVALRVACDGYRPLTTPERETEVAVLDVPKVDFGTITVRDQ